MKNKDSLSFRTIYISIYKKKRFDTYRLSCFLFYSFEIQINTLFVVRYVQSTTVSQEHCMAK